MQDNASVAGYDEFVGYAVNLWGILVYNREITLKV